MKEKDAYSGPMSYNIFEMNIKGAEVPLISLRPKPIAPVKKNTNMQFPRIKQVKNAPARLSEIKFMFFMLYIPKHFVSL